MEFFTREFDKAKGERMCLHLSFHKRSPLDGSLNSGVRKNSCRCLIIDAWIMTPTVCIFLWYEAKLEQKHIWQQKKYFTEGKRTLQLCTKLTYFCMEGKGTPSSIWKSRNILFLGWYNHLVLKGNEQPFSYIYSF